MQDAKSISEQKSRVPAVHSSNWRRTAIALVITALIAGTIGYLLGIRTNQNASQGTQRVSFQPSPTIVQSSSLSVGTRNWKTHTSPYGYSVQYPSDMEHEEPPGGYPFDLRIKSEDFTMLFMLQTLPHNKKLEELATNSVCGDRPNDIKIEEEKINNVLIYRTEETLSDNKLCLRAVTGLNTFLKNPHQPKSQWILHIQAGDINRYSAKLFDDILSTMRLTQ